MSNEAKIGSERRGLFLSEKDADRYFELDVALLEFSVLFDYENPSDRAIAIVGACFWDTILEYALTAFLADDEREVKKLLGTQQPLGTFGARITMCYCLGLIPKQVRDDLRLVASIRNRFAHDMRACFEDDKIRSWCTALKWHRITYVTPPTNASARDLFHVGVNRLVSYLNGIVGQARLHGRDELVFS